MDTNIKNGIYGLAVGDAIGTPVEFCSREDLAKDPVTGMEGYGTYEVAEGTWSDNTCLSLCLMDSLSGSAAKCAAKGKTDNRTLAAAVDCEDIMANFCKWYDEGAFSPTGAAFDVGHATQKAILLKKGGRPAAECGGTDERANGNGALTRIMPAAYYFSPIKDEDMDDVMDAVHNISSLTHGHPISKMACGVMVFIVDAILTGSTAKEGAKRGFEYYEGREGLRDFLSRFDKIRDWEKFINRDEKKIRCGTYVVDTLEAALWSFVNTDSFGDCVLKAVNLGDDTDCIGAVAGALAGVKYGYEAIPEQWLADLKSKEMLDKAVEDFATHKG